MATLTISKENVFVKKIEPLLNSYEELYIKKDLPGAPMGYVVSLRTNLVIHISHTAKTAFRPHSVYQAASMTVLPNKAFMEVWLKKAREAATKYIERGDFTDEKFIAGEWQSWKRKFNQWFYYDKKNGIIVGELRKCPK